MYKFKFRGFTLAEVLITLGIIGVIAAITIPSLMAKLNQIKYRTKYVKTISVLKQNLLQFDNDYGVNWGNVVRCWPNETNNSYKNPEDVTTRCGIFTYAMPKAQKIFPLTGSIGAFPFSTFNSYRFNKRCSVLCNGGYSVHTSFQNIYLLADGILVAFGNGGYSNGEICSLNQGEPLTGEWIDQHRGCLGLIDINNFDKPNKEVSCTNAETSTKVETPCVVSGDGLSDMFPVVFHDGTVEPASNAAKYILNNK